jgi:hypothetical protein
VPIFRRCGVGYSTEVSVYERYFLIVVLDLETSRKSHVTRHHIASSVTVWWHERPEETRRKGEGDQIGGRTRSDERRIRLVCVRLPRLVSSRLISSLTSPLSSSVFACQSHTPQATLPSHILSGTSACSRRAPNGRCRCRCVRAWPCCPQISAAPDPAGPEPYLTARSPQPAARSPQPTAQSPGERIQNPECPAPRIARPMRGKSS